MTNQLQGETLYAGWSGSGDADWATTAWTPVRGDFATFGVEVRTINGLTLTWEIQTRTLEDPTTTTIAGAGGTLTITAPGVFTARNTSAAKQLARYRFKTGGTASTTNFVTLRALQPSWQGDR
jgi:hypothetical protein